jgi:TonB family protein
MMHIMADHKLCKLDLSRKLLTTAAVFATIASPIASGLTNPFPNRSARPEAVILEQAIPTRVRVSQGVMAGLLIKKVDPIYPEDAKNARIQGEVILTAIISKEGEVENLQLLSGHPKLAPAAIEAVKQWKYRSYRLNGEPVEVETKIQVKFALPN